ncbi:MAG TPA: Ig-like domain-containing protein, partial [Isosphaeraceae bacterium]|nr:Ig-like domain-containing protein [Isosphaeraceae bacterium]
MKSRPFRTRSGRNLRLASLEQLEDRRLLATFTVTSTGDSGPGTLRQAIVDSNVQAGPNTIDFNIPGTGVQTIAPISALPAITTPVTIDGYSQPGAHPNTNGPRQGDNATLLIQLDGSNLALSLGSPTGLLVTGGGSTVRGLVIDDFYQGIDLQSDGNTVFGNFIGTTPDGSAVAKGSANRYQPYGIELEGANNQIGGSDPADRNVISGNSTAIWVPNNPARAATGNLAEGNLIGLDATGTKGIYGSDGFDIESGSGMTIGGTASGAGNVISGIDGRAIYILLVGPDSAAHQQNGNGGCLIEGNFIGTDVTGTALVHTTNPNTNQQFQGNRIGILIDYAGYLEPQSPIPSTIGGTAAGAGNVISGNSGVAMSINPDTVGTLVEGNFVGTDLTGTENLGNSGLGLALQSPASTIGGTAAGAANVFAYNHSTSGDAAGVVFGRNASGSSFLGNSVFGNGTEGFITESTAAPAPPVIASVTATSDGKTLIQGTLKDAVNTSFRLEFFSNAVADPSGVGQGQTFLGAAEVTTDATGAASFSATVAAIPAGQGFVVATATDAANNTSGYSKEYVHTQVNPAPTMTKLVVPSSPVIVGQPVTLVAIVSATAGGVPPGSVIFTIDGVAQSPVPLTVSNGQDQATLPETALPVGTHHVTAAYGGNSAFQPSV